MAVQRTVNQLTEPSNRSLGGQLLSWGLYLTFIGPYQISKRKFFFSIQGFASCFGLHEGFLEKTCSVTESGHMEWVTTAGECRPGMDFCLSFVGKKMFDMLHW